MNHPGAALSVHLFGAPQLAIDGRPVKITRRISRAMTYYLAAASRPVTREHLLAFFWPDTPRPAGQQVLRTTLHGLRQALGPALVVEDDHVGLDPDTYVDARVFAQALATAGDDPERVARAIELYRDEFLADFSLPNVPAFEDWAAAERQHFHRLAVRGLTLLSRLYEQRAEYAAALAALDRGLALDPLQEDLQREAMRLAYLSGDRPDAIRRYTRLRELLDAEMGVPPMAETQALYDAIVTDSLPGPALRGVPVPRTDGPPTAVAPTAATSAAAPLAATASAPRKAPAYTGLRFIGRTAELRQVRDALLSHHLALIEGEPGIGKTRLAEEFMRSMSAFSLSGVARELETALPYQPIIEALRGLVARPDWQAVHTGLRAAVPAFWLAEAARLLPELAPAGARPERPTRPADESRLWEGLHQLLVALARQQSARLLVLFIDDLQWADASTLALLGYLVRQTPRGEPVVHFLAATRPVSGRSPAATLVQGLTREGRLTRVPLARLSPQEIIEIAQQMSPAFGFPLAEWLQRNSEGNPYILAELVHFAVENGLLTPDGSLDLNRLSAEPTIPQTVYTLIQARLSRLSEAARRVLETAVAAGREFDFEVVSRAAGLSETAALDALDELESSGFVRPLGGVRYAIDHALIMEVASRELGEARQRLLHRRLAEALESLHTTDRDAVAGLIASHFTAGHAADRAAPYALRAGRRAARLAAWKEAAGFYEQALAGETEPVHRVETLLELGKARAAAGMAPQASEALAASLSLAEAHEDTRHACEARLALAESLLPQGRFAEIVGLLAGFPRLVPGADTLDAAEAERIWGTALSLEGADLPAAAEHLQAAIALLRQIPAGDSGRLALLGGINFELGSVKAQQGDLEQAIELYRAALSYAQQEPDLEQSLRTQVLAHNNLAYHLLLLGRLAEATEHGQAALALAQERGVLTPQPYLYSTLGEIALAQGDLDLAETRFNEGLLLSERFGNAERVAGLTANLGLVALRRGQKDLAIHRLSSGLARAETLGSLHLIAQIRIWLAPLLPPGEGRAVLAEARTIAEASGRRYLLEQIDEVAGQLG